MTNRKKEFFFVTRQSRIWRLVSRGDSVCLCTMAVYGEFIKSNFPKIDDDLFQYVEGILTLFPLMHLVIHTRM